VQLLVVGAVIPVVNIAFFLGILWLGLNSDDHRKYSANIRTESVGISLQRLEQRATEPDASRDFKVQFFDVLEVHEPGHVPSSEKARLLQGLFIRPLRECFRFNLDQFAKEGRAKADFSDAPSKAIAHLLRETEAVTNIEQRFLIAAQDGKQLWETCRTFVPKMRLLVRNFRAPTDIVDDEQRTVFQRRLKMIVDQLDIDDLDLTADQIPGRNDVRRARESIDTLKRETDGRCLSASAEGAVPESLVDACRRSREVLLQLVKDMSRFIGGVADVFEHFQAEDRRTVAEFFYSNKWQFVVYFILMGAANIIVSLLSVRWKVSAHGSHHPEFHSASGHPPGHV
jgi:hypothetical protein